MADPSRLQTYGEFWFYYLREHSLKSCRILHYLGTSLAVISFVIILVSQSWSWLWVPFLAGYGPAWVGHFAFENNRPATFRYPWWSFISDFRMLYYAVTGRLRNELEKAQKKG